MPGQGEGSGSGQGVADSIYSPANQANRNVRRAKFKSPPVFYGDPDQFATWFEAIRLYMRAHRSEFADENGQPDPATVVPWILGFMEGDAAAWRQAYVTDHSDSKGVFTEGTVDDLFKKLKESYEPASNKDDALRRLASIRQGDAPIEAFISHFRNLIAKAGITQDVEKIFHFRNALSPATAYKTIGFAPDSTIDGWYNAARKADQVLQAQSDYRSQHRGKDTSYSRKSSNPSYSSNFNTAYRPSAYQTRSSVQSFKDPYAMDVDAISRKTEKIRNVQEEEEDFDDENESGSDEESLPIQGLDPKVARFINTVFNKSQKDNLLKGLCFSCGKPGHYARNCKNPSRSQSSTIGLIPRNKSFRNQKTKTTDRKIRNRRRMNFIREMIDDMGESDVEDLYEQAAAEESNNIGITLLKDFA